MDIAQAKELLDGPAFDATASIKGPNLGDLVEEKPTIEAEATTSEEQVEETPTGGKKMRIPASRWKTVQATAERAEREAQELRDRLAILETELRSRPTQQDELPDEWKELYGDSEQSKRAYKLQEQAFQKALQQAQSQAREDVVRQEREAREYQQQIADSFDEQMDSLEERLGKELSDKDKSALLDIVEAYSPTDQDGNFTAFLPVEKAYELSLKLTGTNPAKNRIADIAGASSEGTSTASQGSTRPPQWDDWRKRFGG